MPLRALYGPEHEHEHEHEHAYSSRAWRILMSTHTHDRGLGTRGEASMNEEMPKMGVEEPSSDYYCWYFIVMAIHMASVMASWMVSIEFRLTRRVVLRC